MQPTDDGCKRVIGTVASGWPGPYLLKRLRMVGAFAFLRRHVLHRHIFAGARAVTSAAEEFAEKLVFRCPAPKGASDFEELTASLKRCPDTKREFVSTP